MSRAGALCEGLRTMPGKVPGILRYEFGTDLGLIDGNPDIALVDVRMGDMNGYDLCTRSKADAGTQDIKIVLITAAGSP